jgi:hypothetical protein
LTSSTSTSTAASSDYSQDQSHPPTVASNIKKTRKFKLMGWLRKQGEYGLKTWKRRWFKFKDSKLLYFADDTDLKPKGYIELGDMQVARMSADNTGDRFEIVCPQRVWYLQADRERDAQDWVKALNLWRAKHETMRSAQAATTASAPAPAPAPASAPSLSSSSPSSPSSPSSFLTLSEHSRASPPRVTTTTTTTTTSSSSLSPDALAALPLSAGSEGSGDGDGTTADAMTYLLAPAHPVTFAFTSSSSTVTSKSLRTNRETLFQSRERERQERERLRLQDVHVREQRRRHQQHSENSANEATGMMMMTATMPSQLAGSTTTTSLSPPSPVVSAHDNDQQHTSSVFVSAISTSSNSPANSPQATTTPTPTTQPLPAPGSGSTAIDTSATAAPAPQEVARLVRDIHGMQQLRRERQLQLAGQQKRLTLLHDERLLRGSELVLVDRTQPELVAQRKVLHSRDQELHHLWHKSCDIYRAQIATKLAQLENLRRKVALLRRPDPSDHHSANTSDSSDIEDIQHNASSLPETVVNLSQLRQLSLQLQRRLLQLQHAKHILTHQFVHSFAESCRAHEQQVTLLQRQLHSARSACSARLAATTTDMQHVQSLLATARVRLQSLRAQHNLSNSTTSQVHRVRDELSLLRRAFFQALVSNVKLHLVQCRFLVPQTSLTELYTSIAGEQFFEPTLSDNLAVYVPRVRLDYHQWAQALASHFREKAIKADSNFPTAKQQVNDSSKSLVLQPLHGFSAQFIII